VEPPTQPPKAGNGGRAQESAEADGQSVAGTTLAERPKGVEEEHEDEEDEKVVGDQEEEGDADDDDEVEKPEPAKAAAVDAARQKEAAKNETTNGEATAMAEEDGRFDEVSL